MGVALEAPNERQQEGRIALEVLESRERNLQNDRIRVRLGAGVAEVILAVVGEQPDLTDDVTGLVDEGEHEVGRADPTIDDHVERVRGITGVEQDIVLAEGLEVDVLGQCPAVGLAEASEQYVGAEEIADAFALLITWRDFRHGDGFLRGSRSGIALAA